MPWAGSAAGSSSRRLRASTPDIIKPTGAIAGPATANAGQPVAFTLNAADEGGSGLNPASYAWSVVGLPNQGGNPATFTFPSQGSYTVRVTFADNAGNTETATASISVGGPLTGGGSGPGPTFSFTGPGNSATAVIIGNRVRIRMRGTIKPPAGVSTAAACKGKVRLKIKKKTKTIAKRKAKLKLKRGKCRFGKTIFIKRSKSATRRGSS